MTQDETRNNEALPYQTVEDVITGLCMQGMLHSRAFEQKEIKALLSKSHENLIEEVIEIHCYLTVLLKEAECGELTKSQIQTARNRFDVFVASMATINQLWKTSHDTGRMQSTDGQTSGAI